MRTISVIYTEKKVPLENQYAYGHYHFLCNYPNIHIGDIIEDPRYTTKMLVTDYTFNTNRRQRGITLKDIYITKVNGQVINQPDGLIFGSLEEDFIPKKQNKIENIRNIKVKFEQALEWFNSGNSILQRLALSAYTEEELKLNLTNIKKKVPLNNIYNDIPTDYIEKHKVLIDLEIIASYFNGTWKKTKDNIGYYLGQTNYPANNSFKGISIYASNNIIAGATYFKNKLDAQRAIDILGDRIKILFI